MGMKVNMGVFWERNSIFFYLSQVVSEHGWLTGIRTIYVELGKGDAVWDLSSEPPRYFLALKSRSL